MFVIDVQEAKSRCLSLEQNLLRLVHVLKNKKSNNKQKERDKDICEVEDGKPGGKGGERLVVESGES